MFVKKIDEIFRKNVNNVGNFLAANGQIPPKANAALREFFVSASEGSVDFVAAQIIRVVEKVRGGKGESFGEAGVSLGVHGG